jgi:hypothetical protein
MQRLLLLLLLCGSFLLAQDNNSTANGQTNTASNGQITVRGCLDRSRGDYILVQLDPGMTWELQGSNGIKLRHYFGQEVELTGTQHASLSTSSDSIAFGGSPSPVTIRVTSIKTLAKQCSAQQVSR